MCFPQILIESCRLTEVALPMSCKSTSGAGVWHFVPHVVIAELAMVSTRPIRNPGRVKCSERSRQEGRWAIVMPLSVKRYLPQTNVGLLSQGEHKTLDGE